MAKICIVEDDSNHAFSLQQKVKAIGHSVQQTCASFEEVMSVIKENPPDVLLLDINLETDHEGIHIAQAVHNFAAIPIIFTTALTQRDIIEKAIKIKPSGYLVKPIQQETLQATIALALQQSTTNKVEQKSIPTKGNTIDFLTVRVGYKLRKVYLEDIKFLKITSKNYVTLVDKHNKEFQLRNSLKALLQTLNSNFIQIHRLYGVNLTYVEQIDEREQLLYLKERIHVPIGRTFKENLYKRLNIM